MKKIAAILMTSITLISLISCNSKKEEEIKAPEGMMVIDMSKYGKQFLLFVPDSTFGKLEISEQPGGLLEVKVGKVFDIIIKEGEEDIAFKKADLGNDDLYKVKQFLVDEPTTIAWEWGIPDMPSEFHFLTVQKIGNYTYTFEDNKNSDAAPFSKSNIEKMLESCRNIKPVPKKEE
jgi:hypothetical protein